MLVDILTDVGVALLHERQHRVQSLGTRLLYTNILHHGGALAHQFLSKVLLGPDVTTTRRQRLQLEYDFKIGFHSAGFALAKSILDAYGLTGCPLLLVEDGTALQIRIDLDFNATKREVGSHHNNIWNGLLALQACMLLLQGHYLQMWACTSAV